MGYLLSNNFEQVCDQLTLAESKAIIAHYASLDAEDIEPEMSETKPFGLMAWCGRTRQLASAYTDGIVAHRTAWASDPDAWLAHGVTDADRRARLVRGELLTPSNNTARSSARKAYLWTTPASTQTGFIKPGQLFVSAGTGNPSMVPPVAGANVTHANVATFGALCAASINANMPVGYRALRIDKWPITPQATLPGGEVVGYLRDGEATGGWPGIWYTNWIEAAGDTWSTFLGGYLGAGGALDAVLLDMEYQIGRWWLANRSVYRLACTPGAIVAGREYRVTLGAETFAVTATDTSATTLCNAISLAWNALSSGAYPQLSQMSAATTTSGGSTYVRVQHDLMSLGYGIPTALTLSATGGGTFAKSVETVPTGYRYFPHPNYPPGTTWYADLKADARLTAAYIASTYLPTSMSTIELWPDTSGDDTYRFNEQTIYEFRKAIHQAFYLPLIEAYPNCHLFDYDATGKCGNVLPSSDPTSPFGSPLGTNFICGTHQSRNLYSGVNQGPSGAPNTRSDCYVPGTGTVQQSRISEVRYTPSSVATGTQYRATLIGYPGYAGVLTTTNIDYTVPSGIPTAYSVAVGMKNAWNDSVVGHVAKITATAVDTGGGNGYVKYTNDDGNQTCEEITFSVVSGTGSGTRTLQVAGALCRVLDDWWIIQGMLASSSKPLAPYILGPSNATNGNYYSCFGPKWTKAFHVLIQLCSEYVAFWNTGSSATSDAAVAAALDEAIGYLEGTVGVPLVMPVRTSYSVDTPLTQDVLVNGRIKRFTLDKYGDYTIKEQPTLTAIGNKSVVALSELTFTAAGAGGSGAVLSYSLDDEPSGATIHATTGAFSWTPTAQQDEQAFGFKVIVSDATSGLTNGEWVQVEVGAAPGQPPEIDAISPQTASEHTLFTYQVAATDDEYDLDYSLSGAPAGMTINSATGLISWTPNETHGGNAYTPTVIVTQTENPAPEDFTPLSASAQFTVTVTETNTAPVLTPIADKQGAEGSLLTFTATATDLDVPAQTLTFSLTGSPPSGASIHATTGVFTWTPSGSQSGTYTIGVRVTDNGAGSLHDDQDVTVVIAEGNLPPVIVAIPDQAATVGELLAFQVSASDPNGDTLTYSIADDVGAAPAGLAISSTGVVTWTPQGEHGNGVFVVYIRVTDNGTPSFSSLATATLAVAPNAPPPEFASVPNYVAYTGQLFSLNVSAMGGVLPGDISHTLTSHPVGDMAITTAGVFTWTPLREHDGYAYLVCVQARDAYDQFDDVAFYVTVQRPAGVAQTGPAFSPALFGPSTDSPALRRPRRWR